MPQAMVKALALQEVVVVGGGREEARLTSTTSRVFLSSCNIYKFSSSSSSLSPLPARVPLWY